MKIFEKNKGYECRCYVDWFWDKPHTELEIDGTLYNLFLGCSSTIAEVDQRAKVMRGAGRPYVRFEVGLTPGEYEALKRSIQNKDVRISTCSGSVAELLNRVTSCKIPSWQSLSTTGLALYFLNVSEESKSRISSIEIVQYDERIDDSEDELQEIESDGETDASEDIDSIIVEGHSSDCLQVAQWLFCAFFFSFVLGSLCAVACDIAMNG